jgi:hypothetical protein
MLAEKFPSSVVEVVDASYREKEMYYLTTQATSQRAEADMQISPTSFRVEWGKEAELHKFVEQRYSLLIYGSDEIWKVRHEALNPELAPLYPEFPNLYWPFQSQKVFSASYAASFGRVGYETYLGKHSVKMRESLNSLKIIGVRDERSGKIVRDLLGKADARIMRCPDPTLSLKLPLEQKWWSALSKLTTAGASLKESFAIVVLPYLSNEVASELREAGLQVVSSVYHCEACSFDLDSVRLTPLEWFAVISRSAVVVSSRMHACIAGLLGSARVVGFDGSTVIPGQFGKIGALLADFAECTRVFSPRIENQTRLSQLVQWAVSGGSTVKSRESTLKRYREASGGYLACLERMLLDL